MSKVVAPLGVNAYLKTVPGGSMRVELWVEPLRQGEDARLLLREVTNFSSNPSSWIYFTKELDYEISRVSELGQLRIGTYDPYDRPVAVSSVDLLLLSVGESDLNPSGDALEYILIQEPGASKLIQGGAVIVSGLVRYHPDQFLLVELVASDGTVVGYRQLFVTPQGDGSHTPFSIDVPYQVSAPTWVRLLVEESSWRIPGVVHLSSVEVLLSP